MLSVKISELKNGLSRYLKMVQHGERIVILDRDEPVAEITPISASKNDSEWIEGLIAKGIITRGNPEGMKKVLEKMSWPSGEKSSGVLDALLEERRSGR